MEQRVSDEEEKTTEIDNLFKAVKDDNIKLVKRMLKKGLVDINTCDRTDPLRPSVLLTACILERHEIVHALLRNKYKSADVNLPCLMGRRPIWVAIVSGNEDLAQKILQTGRCELNYIDSTSGYSPLYKSILTGCINIAYMLVKYGANVNERCSAIGETLLIRTVQINNIQACQLLINGECNLNTKTEDGLTALHYAVSYCRYDICQLLLENKIKLHAATEHGVTAMSVAIEHNLPRMVQLLIRHGYKMNCQFCYMETPLQQAIGLHSEDCAAMLVKEGCIILRKKAQISYFRMAVNEKLIRLMKLLVDVHPTFLNEQWVREEQWPLAIYQTRAAIEWLIKHHQTPRALRTLCRSGIFKSLGRSPYSKVLQLPIPQYLQNYLCYPEHDLEHETVSLYDKDCPYGCPSLCPERYCPILDISDSDEEEY